MAENNTKASVNQSGGLSDYFALIVIIITMIVGWLIYSFIFGNPNNFIDGDPNNHPVAEGIGKWFGLFHKGGFVIPFALGLVLMTFTFSIERYITLAKAEGKGSMSAFVQKIQMHLDSGNVDEAIAECDRAQGSAGNVIKEVLIRYKGVVNDPNMHKEAKMAAVSKTLEESIALELPMLQRHMIILATLVSIATLVGLIGTVIGMIKAFSALATAGSPDAVALATGISEALINTAIGITNSTFATIFYNYFTSKIESMTNSIDEAGYSIVQTLAETDR